MDDLHVVKEHLDKLKENQKLNYEWIKSYAGSLVLKNPSKDLDEIIQLLNEDLINDRFDGLSLDGLSFNHFMPSEFGETKFIIIHEENIESTQEYSDFISNFKKEINDIGLTRKAEYWLSQYPFFDWKIYALKLLSNITYYKMDKIDKKIEEIKKYMSGLNNFVISNIQGIEKSSVHLFYSLNKLIEDPSIKFIPSQELQPVDSRSIVFIDDIIGTGNQAIKYITKLKKDGKIGHRKLYFFAIIGFKNGIDELKKSGLFEVVIATREIYNTTFDPGYIFRPEESGLARDMAYTIGEQLTKDKVGPLGYENSGALFFFEHNSPNNSLPIFWASGKCKILEALGEHTEVNWVPLFPRQINEKKSWLEPNIERAGQNINNIAGGYIINTPKTQELVSTHATQEQSKSSSILRIFLCHSSGDKPIVHDLYKRLSSEGFKPWLDEEDLIPGQEWQLVIPKAVKESNVVIVCLSRSSIGKEGYVQKEIKYALDAADEKPEGTIFIIPLKLEECKVPDRLSRYQWVNLFEDKGFEKLMRALQVRENQLKKK